MMEDKLSLQYFPAVVPPTESKTPTKAKVSDFLTEKKSSLDKQSPFVDAK